MHCMFKCQFRNLFYLMFQSEPEEMPPEAKMRMKNIGRLDFIWIQLNLILIVSYSIVLYNTVLLTTFWFSEKRPHQLDPIPSTKESRDSQTIRNFGRGSLNPTQTSSVWLLPIACFLAQRYLSYLSLFDKHCTNVYM